MEKPSVPSPRRLASSRVLLQERESRRRSDDDGSVNSAEAANAQLEPSSDGSTKAQGTSVDQPHCIDRTVRTRTHDRITLHGLGLDEDAAPVRGERGWRSPHGEPYRPLGNPELSLRFSPRRHGDLVATTIRSPNRAKEDGGRREPALAPAPVLTAATTKSCFRTDVMDMFPRHLRRRPADDRQLKLARRLEQSVANYSPTKTRGLRCSNSVTITQLGSEHQPPGRADDRGEDLHTAILRLQQQHCRDTSAASLGAASSSSSVASASASSTPLRFHVQHGDNSSALLHTAVHDGATRLQLVRNGQHFLGDVPSSEALDLVELKRAYDLARDQYLADQDAHKKVDTHNNDHHNREQHHHSSHGSEDSDEHRRLYLPYTTREPQVSPRKPLPTLAEFKAKVRDERMLPVRSLVSSRASMAVMAPATDADEASQSPRKLTASRPSRLAVSLIAGSRPPSPERRGIQAIAALSPTPQPLASPPAANRKESRRRSVMLVSSEPPDPRSPLRGAASDSDALARAVVSLAPSLACPPPRVHSVVGLQHAIDRVERLKEVQTRTLAQTLSSLDQDRRDCLAAKYRNCQLELQLDQDMAHMRAAAEFDRLDSAARNAASYTWYPELLRHVVVPREASQGSSGLHPAEHFCLDAIRRIARDGHAFRSEQLFRVVSLLHAEDVALPEVQHILTFLGRALGIPRADWEPFFRLHGLPEPVESFTPSDELKLKEKKKQTHMAKLRSVVRIRKVLRRLTLPTPD